MTSTTLRAWNQHPEQILRERNRRRRRRIVAIKVRFIGLIFRLLREQACESVLVPHLEARGMDAFVVVEVLSWHRRRGEGRESHQREPLSENF